MKQQLRYAHLINTLVIVGDFLIINALMAIFYSLFNDHLASDFQMKSWLVLLAANLSYALSITVFGVKLSRRIIYAERVVQNTFWTTVLFFVTFMAFMALVKVDEASRLFVAAYFMAVLVVLVLWRLGFRFALKHYRNLGFNYKNIIIIGAGKNGVAVYNEMLNEEGAGFNILGFFDDNPRDVPDGAKILGDVDSAIDFIKANPIDEVYCTLPDTAERKIMSLLGFCENNMIRFYIVPVVHRYMKKALKLDSLGNIPVFALRNEPLQYPLNKFVKRTFDIVFSLIFLVTIFPIVFVIVAVGIKAGSPGPIFFVQERTGKKGRSFKCYKFRTMRVNGQADTAQAVKGDPRVTRFGAFLRRSNLDELPQFFNVLAGNMSVVGPRPHMLKHTIEYSAIIDKYMLRHLAKPGITGWAQVNGYRGETKEVSQMEKRVEHDVWYIENWSFFLDLKIIYLTVKNMIRGEKNAY